MSKSNDSTSYQVILVKVGNSTVDEVVHLLVRNIVEREDGRVLNLTQRWTPFKSGAPIAMVIACSVEKYPDTSYGKLHARGPTDTDVCPS